MNSNPQVIDFYFDYISTNAYLAWHELRKIAQRFDRTVRPVPVLFAGFLEQYGQLGPAEVLPKAYWMWKNNLRKAALLGLPLNPPAFHPFNPLLALRISSVPMAETERDRLISSLFDAVWVEGHHVSEPSVVEAVASAIGLPGKQLVELAQSPESKQRLRDQTDAAIASGVFGVPSMVVGSEVFWGYDDLPYLELHLDGKDPFDPETAFQMRQEAPRPSAQRSRVRDRK